jgi:hypothetical protein
MFSNYRVSASDRFASLATVLEVWSSSMLSSWPHWILRAEEQLHWSADALVSASLVPHVRRIQRLSGVQTSDHALDYGSTILSEDTYKENVAELLKLTHPMSYLLREELSSDNVDALERSSREFAAVSIGLKKIWSFVEGQETVLVLSETRQNTSAPDDSTTTLAKNARTTTFFKTPVSLQKASIELV